MFRKTISLLFITACISTCMHAQATMDRVHWKQMSLDERSEFLAGYIDCSMYDARENFRSNVLSSLFEEQVSHYYATAGNSEMPFSKVVETLDRKQKIYPSLPGEYYPEKHGFFDGQYWVEMTEEGRLGFVRGYQECQRTKLPNPDRYRMKPFEQVHQIDDWYGANLTVFPDAIVKRIDSKIADILARFEK